METFLLKLVPFYMLMVLTVSIAATEYSRPLPHRSNHWMFNMTDPIAFLFLFFLLLHGIKLLLLRKISVALIAIYSLFALYNITFLQGFRLFNHYSFVGGSFVIVCMCLFFFLEAVLLDSEEPIVKSRMFWIVSGLLVLYMGDFIILGLVHFATANPGFSKISFDILRFLGVTMNLLFIVAFLRGNSLAPQQPQTQLSSK